MIRVQRSEDGLYLTQTPPTNSTSHTNTLTQTKAISLGVALIIKGGLMDKRKELNKVRVLRSHKDGKCSRVSNAVRDRVYIKCSCGAFTIIELNNG